MQFYTLPRYPDTVRIIDCPGLATAPGGADLQISRNRAHVTLLHQDDQNNKNANQSSGMRFLRSLEYSNSLLITYFEEAEVENNNNNNNADDDDGELKCSELKATALHRNKVIFESDNSRCPTELVEAVLRPTSISFDELEGTEPATPVRKLWKLSQLLEKCMMPKKELVQYLTGRAAMFTPVAASSTDNKTSTTQKDFYVRLLEPSLLRTGVLDICAFLATQQDVWNAFCKDKKQQEQTTEEQQQQNHVFESNVFAPLVRAHFEAAQFPLLYDLCWKYMTSPTSDEGWTSMASSSPVAPSTGGHFNLQRVSVLLGQAALARSEIAKQTLSELWEDLRAHYWFLKEFGTEQLLRGFFIATEHRGVFCAPHPQFPHQLSARITKLFQVVGKWNRDDLVAYLAPIADTRKELNAVIGRRCRPVVDAAAGVTWVYLV